MKWLGQHPKRRESRRSSADVQQSPIEYRSALNGEPTRLKVDLALRFGEVVLIAGWRTGQLKLGLELPDSEVTCREVPVSRPDVARHFGLTSADGLGFVLVATCGNTQSLQITWEGNATEGQLSQGILWDERPTIEERDKIALGSALGLLALDMQAHTPEWRRFIAKAPSASGRSRTAHGFLEAGSSCELTSQAVVVGWEVHLPGVVVWLEDDDGNTYSLDSAFRRFRQDVHDAVGDDFQHVTREAGFIVRISGPRSGGLIRLRSLSEAGLHTLSEARLGVLPQDPTAAARWLFAIDTPLDDLHRRIALIDKLVLTPIIAHRQAVCDELPAQTREVGVAPNSPSASIIVPLYRRTDFVEHQLIEFADDDWLRHKGELIYVVDDPRVVEAFSREAESLYRLYRVPFRWVFGNSNRGFSGANNLGAQVARGDTLVFLNSDAFPQRSGWLKVLADVLAQRPDIGAVSPRLVFGDGSIQHAGMEFLRRSELGIWINHHPYMGLDASLDPHAELTIVPAITGACLAVRRTDFERVGGWDTGYLIGDFEDSDLCMKLRAEGLEIAYLPAVQLTHLERQSFKTLGEDQFRNRVVVYNAVRHQQRWASFIESSASASSGDPTTEAVR